MSGKLHVTIDRLVLRGFAPEEARLASAEFRAELARLLSAEQAGGFGASRHMAALPAGPAIPAHDPRSTGRQAAQQLVKGLRP